MTTRTSDPDTATRTKRPRRAVPALATFVAIVAAGAAFVALNRGSQIFSFGPPSPVEVAMSYFEARNAYDAAAARALFTDDAGVDDTPIMSLDEFELGFEALRVYELSFVAECAETGTYAQTGGTFVSCDTLMDGNLQRIVGYGSVEGSFVFIVNNGLIESLYHGFNFADYAPNVFIPFADWLDAEHPGVYEQIYTTVGGTDTPILTPEALDLLDRYIDEYDQSVNG